MPRQAAGKIEKCLGRPEGSVSRQRSRRAAGKCGPCPCSHKHQEMLQATVAGVEAEVKVIWQAKVVVVQAEVEADKNSC